MPKKKANDLIVEDPAARALLEMLLGKWGDIPEIEEHFTRTIQGDLVRAEAVLRNSCFPGDYNAGVGRKPAMDFDEWIDARNRRLQNTVERFKAGVGAMVKDRLILALNDAARFAVAAEVAEIERRIKNAAAKRKGKRTRALKEIIGTVDGQQYHFGRPKTPAEEVKRRSIEIIRAISAGKRDLQKVAVAFHGGLDCSRQDATTQARRMYHQADARERKKAGDRYAALLTRCGLSFDGLIEMSTKVRRAKK